MLFTESIQELVGTAQEMAVFLLECKEDEESQAGFPGTQASSPVLETTASFTNSAILNLMVSNNIIIVFCNPFSFHVTAIYTESCIQSQFSGSCGQCVHLVFLAS